MNHISTLQTSKSIRRTWGFKPTERVHDGRGKRGGAYDRQKQNRDWKNQQN